MKERRTSRSIGLALAALALGCGPAAIEPGAPASDSLAAQENAPRPPTLTLTALRCEHEVEPLDLETSAPRFSWKLAPVDPARRGLVQGAYRVRVAASVDALAEEHGALWDSGRVASRETLDVAYDMHWPYFQRQSARPLRRSPLHDRTAANGAVFGELLGWERPNWYAPEGVEHEYVYSYGRQNWFQHAAAEHRAVREAAGVFDISTYGKFSVQGRDAVTVLQRICAADIDVEPGRIVYTQWLNERGGIEADVTVTRESETRYLVVTAATTQTRDLAYLRRHIGPDDRAVVVDVTSGFATFGVMGPNSRAMLQSLTPDDLGNDAFPFGASREIDLGYARVRASRITYVGELGWELYVPTEFAASVFDVIIGDGDAHGLRLAGYHALNSLRMEKAYRHWGHDISPDENPVEAGLGFAVAWDKPAGFIGQAAAAAARERGVHQRLTQFRLPATAPLLYHNEPIWRDGVLVGRITSGMFGHTAQAPLGMGYVSAAAELATAEWIGAGTYEIEVAGERFAADASLKPWFDPSSARVRG